MFENVTTQVKGYLTQAARELQDQQAKAEMLKTGLPIMLEAGRLAEKARELSRQASGKYAAFYERFPFFSGEQSAPAYDIFRSTVLFLSGYAKDGALRDLSWVTDEYAIRRAMATERDSLPFAEVQEFTDADRAAAWQAYRELLVILADDAKALFSPIEHYFKHASEAVDLARHKAYELEVKTGQAYGWGYAPLARGHAGVLIGLLLRNPATHDLLKQKDNYEDFWRGCGQARPERPAWATQRLVRVRVGMAEKWIPVDQLADFIAGK